MPEYLGTFVISVIGGLASGATGLFGLTITQRYTDNRKLIDGTLQELEKLTDECAKAAGVAWSQPGDPGAVHTIETVCLLHDLSTYTAFVADRVPTVRLRVNPLLLNFRRKTTGGDFDVRERLPDLTKVSEIRSAAASLKMAYRSVVYDRNNLSIPFFSD